MQSEPRGILDPQAGRPFAVWRLPPEPALAEIVEQYWGVRWDVPGREPYVQHVLAHPSVHLTAERDRSGIYGITTGLFTRHLRGRGQVFGVKFRPAGFHPFLGSPVSALTDRTVAVSSVFGEAGDALVDGLVALPDEAATVALAGEFLRIRLPEPDPVVTEVNRVVAGIAADRALTRVDQVSRLAGLGVRALQRLFRQYVGVGPKWVIQRYRLHEAAERLARGEAVDLAGLAVELGYFDQAHFARDFRAVVGRPPAAYARGG